MTFALTKYIYPLESEIVLSKTLGFSLDNPRNDSELEIIKDFISETLEERDREVTSKMAPLPIRVASSLDDLEKKLEENGKDEYALNYYKKNNEKSILDILAETWIIVRIPDQEEFSTFHKNFDKLWRTVMSREESSYTKTFKDLSDYCHLLSLLANDDEQYHGETFLLSSNPYELFFKAKNRKVFRAIENFLNYNFLILHENRATDWLYWIDGYEKLIKESSHLETLMIQDKIKEDGKKIRQSQKQSPKQKLLHIGSLLKTSYDHLKDPELMLLILVGIIEYLVTRNPDNNKFNVEDSISKQFNLKCAVLIHNKHPEYDMIKLNADLKRIYSQRSDFAHGNYKEDFKVDEIVESVFLLFGFNKCILNEYIDDRQLVEYLKDN